MHAAPAFASSSAASPVAGLKGALNYVRAYRNQFFVIKLGGEVLGDESARAQIAAQIALLSSLGIRVVLVHGGGPQVSALSRQLGHQPVLIAGRRVTDADALTAVKRVCRGEINLDLVAALKREQVAAVGLSGADGELLTAIRRPPIEVRGDDGRTAAVDYGQVGEITAVNCRVLKTLLAESFVPVIASLAAGTDGTLYNINADTVAQRLAVALGAHKLIFLTSAPGVLSVRENPATLIPFASPEELQPLLASGVIAGGMRPKVEACIRAATQGVARTHIIDGRTLDGLLLEIFTGAGCGTMIVGQKEKLAYVHGELHDRAG